MVQGSEQYLEVDLKADAPYGPFTNYNISFPAGESTFGVENGSPVWLGVEVIDDGFSLQATMQREAASIKANLAVQRAGQVIGVEAAGSMNAVPAAADKRSAYGTTGRAVTAWILGAALNRKKSTGQLRSYSMRWTTPEISTEKFLGCKANTLTIEASEDSGTVSMSLDWIAASYQLDALVDGGTGLVFPKRPPKLATDLESDAGEGWAFARAYIFSKKTNDSALTLIATARSLTITVNNNLDPAAPRVKTVISNDATDPIQDTFVVTEFREQAIDISGSLVIDYTTDQYSRDMLSDSSIQIVLLARHPQSRAFGVTDIVQNSITVSSNWTLDGVYDTTLTIDPFVGSYQAYNSLSVSADDFLLIDGNVVMLECTDPSASSEDSVSAYQRDVAVIKPSGGFDGTDVILQSEDIEWWEPLGIQMYSTDMTSYILYDQALAIHLTAVKIDTGPLEGGAADIMKQNLSFSSSQSDPDIEPIKWAVSGLSHEAGV
ncbi:MAG: hypothetical protein ACI88C_000048 [Acidimicrobiales bacterium]|jgi:hypothetical protein